LHEASGHHGGRGAALGSGRSNSRLRDYFRPAPSESVGLVRWQARCAVLFGTHSSWPPRTAVAVLLIPWTMDQSVTNIAPYRSHAWILSIVAEAMIPAHIALCMCRKDQLQGLQYVTYMVGTSVTQQLSGCSWSSLMVRVTCTQHLLPHRYTALALAVGLLKFRGRSNVYSS
jgi:hypothetical protein